MMLSCHSERSGTELRNLSPIKNNHQRCLDFARHDTKGGKT
jgi:hypothetical protein